MTSYINEYSNPLILVLPVGEFLLTAMCGKSEQAYVLEKQRQEH